MVGGIVDAGRGLIGGEVAVIAQNMGQTVAQTTAQDIAKNLRGVTQRVAHACVLAGRDPAEVMILPVSKTFGPPAIRTAYECGYRVFGENRSQEAAAKAAALADLDLSWTMIGHLQTNKVKQVAGWADEFQALDSVKLAAVLDRQLQYLGRSMRVYLEVNTSGEPSKYGVVPNDIAALAAQLVHFSSLEPVGLMTVAHPDPRRATAGFAQLALLRSQVQEITGNPWPELSMGMSGDFESAIASGSTVIRVGSAIFGTRSLG